LRFKNFIEKFFNKFSADETTTLAASLAFYTALSLAPLLILFITIAAQFSPELQRDFLNQVQSMVGTEGAKAVNMVINGAKDRPDLTSIAGTFGILTLLLSASLILASCAAP
jgi:membrane protein